MRNRLDCSRSLAKSRLHSSSFQSGFSPPFGLTSRPDRAPLPAHPVHKVPIRDMGTRRAAQRVNSRPSRPAREGFSQRILSRPCINAQSPFEQEATSACHAVCPQKGLGSALPIHQCFSLRVFDASVERPAVLSSLIDVLHTHSARIIHYGRSHLGSLPARPDFHGHSPCGPASQQSALEACTRGFFRKDPFSAVHQCTISL